MTEQMAHSHCSFRKYLALSRCAACPGTAEEICVTNTPCTLHLPFQILTEPRNLFNNTLPLSRLIRSLHMIFTADIKYHPRKAKQGLGK